MTLDYCSSDQELNRNEQWFVDTVLDVTIDTLDIKNRTFSVVLANNINMPCVLWNGNFILISVETPILSRPTDSHSVYSFS